MADVLFGGRVAVKEELGRGAMGVVHRAELEGETVAIKILHAHLTADVAVVGRFVREHQALRRVQHPNVVKVNDLVIGDPLIGMVMEYLDATDLSVVLRDDQPDPAQAVTMMADIAAGVAAIHKANVVHRDLKPANIMITDDGGQAKITDFGISRLLSADEAGRTTATIGTPLYMSPESAGSGDPIGSPSDIYSLGVILFEMLVGQPPFTGSEPLAVAVAHVNNPPPSVGGVPDELSSLIDSMLSKIPGERPTAVEVEERLRALAPSMSGNIDPVIVPTEKSPSLTLEAVGSDDGRSSSSSDFGSAGETAVINLLDGPGQAGSPGSAGEDTDQTAVVAGVGAQSLGSVDHTSVAGPPMAYSPGSGNPMLETDPAAVAVGAGLGSTPGVGLADDNPTVISPIGATEPSVNLLNRTGESGVDGTATMGSPPFNGSTLGGGRALEMGVDDGPSRVPVMAAIGGVLLVGLLLVMAFRPGGWLRSSTDEGPSIAYSFTPTLASNGLITTRLWSFNPDEALVQADVVITNTTEDEIDLNHYEVMPAFVDRDEFLDSLTPNPDEVRTAGGARGSDGASGGTLTVARFTDRSLGEGQTFRIRYSFTAPEETSGLAGLEELAFDQQAAEIDFLATIPSADVPVEVKVDQLELDPSELALDVGATAAVSLTGSLADGEEALPALLELASWTVEDPSVATVSGNGLLRTVNGEAEGQTMLVVQLGEVEVEILIVVGEELSGPNAPSVTLPSTTSETSETTDPEEPSTTETTEEEVIPDLTMSSLGVTVNDDGSFRITFQTNLCTIANYQGAGQSYITPGWPNVVDRCWESHAQPFTAVDPGSYTVSVSSRSADGQQATRTATVVVEEPEEPVENLTMSALGVTVNADGSFRITFQTNLCTIANYQGAGQSYVTPGWPDVTGTCWESHGQPFTAVDPGSYEVTVSSRSADGQQATRRATVVISEPGTTETTTDTTEPTTETSEPTTETSTETTGTITVPTSDETAGTISTPTLP